MSNTEDLYKADGGWPTVPAQRCDFCGDATRDTYHVIATGEQRYAHPYCVDRANKRASKVWPRQG